MVFWTIGVKRYEEFMARRDPRTDGFPMMSSPWLSFSIVFAYLVYVLWIGPRTMEKRKTGYNLRGIMVIYNLCMVLFSAYLCYEFAMSGWIFGGYKFGCQPVDWSNSPQALRMVHVCWLFYISKFIELFDTVLFVLRKKFELVTFLHVFHHAAMPASWWFGVRFVPGGFGTFHAFINCFIHLLMYTYYGLAAAGPMFHPYLWWKKYMTRAQIVQFMLVFVHTVNIFFQKDCDYPMGFAYSILAYDIIFLALFANFYIQAYIKGRRDPHKRTVKQQGDSKTGQQNGYGNQAVSAATNDAASKTGKSDMHLRRTTRKDY